MSKLRRGAAAIAEVFSLCPRTSVSEAILLKLEWFLFRWAGGACFASLGFTHGHILLLCDITSIVSVASKGRDEISKAKLGHNSVEGNVPAETQAVTGNGGLRNCGRRIYGAGCGGVAGADGS